MLFSARRRDGDLRSRVGGEGGAAWPAELPAPTVWTSSPCVLGIVRAARRDPLSERLEPVRLEPAPSDPHPRMIVLARRTSPPSRVRSAGGVDLVMHRVTRISAPSRRACSSAFLASSAPDTPEETRVVLDAGQVRPQPRHLLLDGDDSEALRCPVTAAASPAAHRRSRCRIRRLRLGRQRGLGDRRGCATTVLPSTTRAPDSHRRRAVPHHCSASSGTSGCNHRCTIWLRSRKRRSSVHDASQRCPITIARGGGASRREPWSRRVTHAVRRQTPTSSASRAPPLRRRGSPAARSASRGSPRRHGTRRETPCRA